MRRREFIKLATGAAATGGLGRERPRFRR